MRQERRDLLLASSYPGTRLSNELCRLRFIKSEPKMSIIMTIYSCVPSVLLCSFTSHSRRALAIVVRRISPALACSHTNASDNEQPLQRANCDCPHRVYRACYCLHPSGGIRYDVILRQFWEYRRIYPALLVTSGRMTLKRQLTLSTGKQCTLPTAASSAIICCLLGGVCA